jgi:uncharacterized membrane protein YfcA
MKTMINLLKNSILLVDSIEFIRFGEYNRKITFFTFSFGVIGVLFAVYIVKSLNLPILQWVVAAIVFHAGINMLFEQSKNKQAAQA